jgi:hypothetical protein
VRDDWAKQLQDAGFPRFGGHGHQAGVSRSNAQAEEPERPTLSELIAACPKQFGTATFVLGSAQSGARWTATYFDFRNNKMVDDDTLCQSGDSPEQAVAKLWLAARTK